MESQPNNYAPPKSHVADIRAGVGLEKAGRLQRAGAVALDGIIFSLPYVPGYAVSMTAMTRMAMAGQMPKTPLAVYAAVFSGMGIWFWIGTAVSLGVWGLTAYWVHQNGQTIAKKIVGIKVVRTDGSRATLARIFWLRNVVNTVITLIPFLGAVYGLADALFIFGDARQCLHDKIADTIVIRA